MNGSIGGIGLGGILVLNPGFTVTWTPLLFYYFVFAIFLFCYFSIILRLIIKNCACILDILFLL